MTKVDRIMSFVAMGTVAVFFGFLVGLTAEPKVCPQTFHMGTNIAGYLWLAGIGIITLWTILRPWKADA